LKQIKQLELLNCQKRPCIQRLQKARKLLALLTLKELTALPDPAAGWDRIRFPTVADLDPPLLPA